MFERFQLIFSAILNQEKQILDFFLSQKDKIERKHQKREEI